MGGGGVNTDATRWQFCGHVDKLSDFGSFDATKTIVTQTADLGSFEALFNKVTLLVKKMLTFAVLMTLFFKILKSHLWSVLYKTV